MQFKKSFLTIITCLFSSALFAQINGGNIDYRTPKEYTIGGIIVKGAENFDENAILLIAGLRIGDKITVPGDKFAKAIKNLWAERLFSDIEIYGKPGNKENIFLFIEVTGRKRLSKFKFNGLSSNKVKKVKDEIDLYKGKIITENLIVSTEKTIRGYFNEKGYLRTKVEIIQKPDTAVANSNYFIINVDRGERIKIKEITFEGNTEFSDGKLRRTMKDTKNQSLLNIFSRSKFNRTAFERDKQLVLDKYHEVGMRDVEIIKDSIYDIDEKHIGIKIYLNEGPKYYFGNITWLGNSKFRSGQLDTLLGIKPGDVYNKKLLEERLFASQDGSDISSLYMDRGHLFFSLQPVETQVRGDSIDFEMRITEGKKAYIKNVFIRGNTKTNDRIILREIRTKPGDLFSRNDIVRTQRELANLGYLDPEQFQVNPMPNPQDGTVDIEYVVAEKSSDQIELSGGFGAGRLVGTLGLSFNNFSVKNMFKKGAWTPLPSGDGQKLSIRAQTNGKFFQSYNFSFTEPWLGGKKPNSFSLAAFHSLSNVSGLPKNDPDRRSVSITGASVGLGRRLKWPDDYFSEYHELSYEFYNMTNYNFFVYENGVSHNLAYQYILSRNSVDNPLYPKEGSKITFSAKVTFPYSLFDGIDDYNDVPDEQLYKWAEYYKLKFTTSWFSPLTNDKKLVLNTKVGFGFLGSYSSAKGPSAFERFYLGGSGLTGFQLDSREIIALRGYDDLSLSPDVGAMLIAKYTLELRYPITLNPQATIYTLAFAEAGNTWSDFKEFNPFKVNRSVGVGVRVFLPMFGLLGVDYGWGFDQTDSGASSAAGVNAAIQQKGYYGKFHFTIGMNLGEL